MAPMILEHPGNEGNDIESGRERTQLYLALFLISSVPLAMAVIISPHALPLLVLERCAWEIRQLASITSSSHPFEPDNQLPKGTASASEDLSNLVVKEGAVEGARTLLKRGLKQKIC
jgi:hypothetical protein